MLARFLRGRAVASKLQAPWVHPRTHQARSTPSCTLFPAGLGDPPEPGLGSPVSWFDSVSPRRRGLASGATHLVEAASWRSLFVQLEKMTLGGGKDGKKVGLPWLSADHHRLGSWDPNQSSAAPLTGRSTGAQDGVGTRGTGFAELPGFGRFPGRSLPFPGLALSGGWRPNFRLRSENFRVLPCSPEARLLAEGGLPMLGKEATETL